MRDACEESLLNKLLNEMDGLREDAQIMFILTTNRPDQLEAALASRPGRIDQAVEFPLPDANARAQLIRLYSNSLEWDESLLNSVVKKTKNTTPAFIKELIRKAAQFMLSRNEPKRLSEEDVRSALEEMLFTGGSLNMKLLGGANSVNE
ncbi:AAA family ATPase, partial [bacterium AH-315-E10]|nr:AAA family ATPase [bacterium AH-315-E10]